MPVRIADRACWPEPFWFRDMWGRCRVSRSSAAPCSFFGTRRSCPRLSRIVASTHCCFWRCSRENCDGKANGSGVFCHWETAYAVIAATSPTAASEKFWYWSDHLKWINLDARTRLRLRVESLIPGRSSDGLLDATADDHPIATGTLGNVQGVVRRLQKAFRVACMGRKFCKAQRCGDGRQQMSLVRNFQPANGFQDLLAPLLRGFQRRIRHQDHEFFAAETAGDVAAAHMRLQQLADGAQYRVAGLVPVLVVIVLEVIDIEDQQRSRIAAAAGAHDLLGKAGIEEAPVEQPGQRIAQRLAPQGTFCFPDLHEIEPQRVQHINHQYQAKERDGPEACARRGNSFLQASLLDRKRARLVAAELGDKLPYPVHGPLAFVGHRKFLRGSEP